MAEGESEQKILSSDEADQDLFAEVEKLKKAKCELKTTFTNTRRKLLVYLSSDVELRRNDLVKASDDLEAAQRSAVSCMNRLADLYLRLQDISSWKKVNKEVEGLLADYNTAQNSVSDVLTEIISTSSSARSSRLSSAAASQRGVSPQPEKIRRYFRSLAAGVESAFSAEPASEKLSHDEPGIISQRHVGDSSDMESSGDESVADNLVGTHDGQVKETVPGADMSVPPVREVHVSVSNMQRVNASRVQSSRVMPSSSVKRSLPGDSQNQFTASTGYSLQPVSSAVNLASATA